MPTQSAIEWWFRQQSAGIESNLDREEIAALDAMVAARCAEDRAALDGDAEFGAAWDAAVAGL